MYDPATGADTSMLLNDDHDTDLHECDDNYDNQSSHMNSGEHTKNENTCNIGKHASNTHIAGFLLQVAALHCRSR